MRIKTHYDPPPVPLRQFDWHAIDDDTYDGAEDAGPLARVIGYGRTEQDAIDDLMEQLAEVSHA